jgi:hypothetical protein
MSSLYELSNEYLAVQNKLVEAEFDEQTIADTLEGMSGDLEVKAENVGKFILNLEAQANAIKDAEKRMAERRKAIEAKAESIRKYLKDNMDRCGITKIESPYFALTIKTNPPSVIIDDASAIPVGFLKFAEPPPPAPDKKLIADAIKAGEVVEGAHLESATRLDIK